MTGTITLEDGSDLHASNLGLGGTLKCIAEAIQHEDGRLARWLVDISKRCGGCMDFDLRGLTEDHRVAFWIGLERAHEKYREWDQEAAFSPTVGVIRQFYERRDAHTRAVPDESVEPIDLEDLWITDESDAPDLR